MGILTEAFNKYESEKGDLDVSKTSWYGKYEEHCNLDYARVYEDTLDLMTNEIKCLVEIGICDMRFPGASLKAWYEYLPNAHIYGLDNFWNNENTKSKYIDRFNNDRTDVIYCDQNNRLDLVNAFDIIKSNNKEIDIIIDDGSHWSSSIIISLATTLPYLKSGGFYFIEDIQTELVLKYQQSRFAFDNVQILNALLSLQNTKYLPRLYITREEHKYLVDNIAYIDITYHNGLVLATITKK